MVAVTEFMDVIIHNGLLAECKFLDNFQGVYGPRTKQELVVRFRVNSTHHQLDTSVELTKVISTLQVISTDSQLNSGIMFKMPTACFLDSWSLLRNDSFAA